MEEQRRIKQRVLQVFPTRVPQIVAVKVTTEEEVEATRRVVLNTNLEDSDQGMDSAVVTV